MRTSTVAHVDVLLVVDMQAGLVRGQPKHDLVGVVERINRLAARVRQRGGSVIFVQHAGPVGDDFEPSTPGWQLLSTIECAPGDRIVSKTLNDPFFRTSLQTELADLRAHRVLVTGWATDLCVDATVRSAAALGFSVVAVADCHTVSDRPHLSAEHVITHHHWVWANLIAPHPVTIVPEADVYARSPQGA
jgi:nicotinamidase-related amidase